jgi:hypothetical protein
LNKRDILSHSVLSILFHGKNAGEKEAKLRTIFA